MATRRIREFLDGSGARYVLVSHSPTYTAQETAQSAHVPGRKMAKTVLVLIDGAITMAVVPATKEVDLELLRRQANAQEVRLAPEADFSDRFVGCQLGSAPPFGNLFGVQTYIDISLIRRDEIAFTAGAHTEIIIMKTADYLRLVHPRPLRIAVERKGVVADDLLN